MSRLFQQLLVTVAVAALAIGTAGAASAAPVHHLAVTTAPAHSLVQPVHWVYRHHHRFWVADHHHH